MGCLLSSQDEVAYSEYFVFDPGIIVSCHLLLIVYHSYGCLLSDFIKEVKISSKGASVPALSYSSTQRDGRPMSRGIMASISNMSQKEDSLMGIRGVIR